MSKKKVSKKKVSSKAKNDIDINDIDAMIEDMKKLALSDNINESKKEMQIKEEVQSVEVIEDNNNEEVVKEESQVENEVVVESVEKEEEIVEEKQQEEEEIILDNEEEVTEENDDLSFIDSIKEEEKEVEKPKSRKMTYEEMFGNTWMGYGYTYN